MLNTILLQCTTLYIRNWSHDTWSWPCMGESRVIHVSRSPSVSSVYIAASRHSVFPPSPFPTALHPSLGAHVSSPGVRGGAGASLAAV